MAKLTLEEEEMMKQLLEGLDDTLSDYVPTPAKPKAQTQSKTPKRSPLLQKPKKLSQSPLVSKKARGKENARQQAVFSKKEIDSLMEGVDDMDWDDMLLDLSKPPPQPKLIPKPAPPAPPRFPEKVVYSAGTSKSKYTPDPCTRCIVTSVEEKSLPNYRQEKHLVVCVDRGPKSAEGPQMQVILQDDWVLTTVHPGDTINVIGNFRPSTSPLYSKSISITAKQNTLILHPDLLITSTSISSTSQCARKPLISSLLQSPFNVTEASTWGSMLHQVMQDCLGEGRWEKTFVEDRIDKVVRGAIPELLRIDVGVEKAKEEVRKRAIGVRAFAEKFIGKEPKPNATLDEARAASSQAATLALTGLHDIEEDMWSPTYGLKGKLDASVQTTIREQNKSSGWTMPFEIKTGRKSGMMEHRAQTALYTLLMSERYLTEVPAGLLYYTQSDELIRVKPSRHELRGLIIARNNTAYYMIKRQKAVPAASAVVEAQGLDASSLPEADIDFLPPTIDQEFNCNKCYAVDGCMLYRKAVENVVDTTSEISELYDLKTSHLTPERAKFFRDWERLLSLEEQDMIRFRKELWTLTAAQREKAGRCFSAMVLDQETQKNSYRFVRQDRSSKGTHNSLLNGHIAQNDAVTISIEPDLLALARGFVTELSPTHVNITFDKPLAIDGVPVGLRQSHKTLQEKIYRIDKDEMTAGMSRIRHNLASLFFAGELGDSRRLELVVDLRKPVFSSNPITNLPRNPNLNESQLNAMHKTLRAQDYALVLGMPGTGKTTTIAEIIKELVVRRGKTVLLTSYTHSAVDTILRKLLDVGGKDFDILRLGNPDKVHPDVRKFTLAQKDVPTSLEQMEHQIFGPPVIATTCLSIDHPLFSRRKFDYCIVDEASQITLPTCLGPLRFADKFVLVGDHHQLPPLVRSKSAKKGGLDVSLFRRLSEAHPDSVVDLVYQYRMNADIMHLANKLIYNDRLKCGNDVVASQVLDLARPNGLTACGSPKACWLEQVLDPQRKVVFLDTDDLPALDSRVGDLVQNEGEATLVKKIVFGMIRCGVSVDQIGVISPYRQQIKLLSHLLHSSASTSSLEILTADKSQGRDKDVIVMSMVRANDGGLVGDLLKDWRRMNVSLTRAKRKLIVVGSRKTLEVIKLFNDFFGVVEEKGWLVRVGKGDMGVHQEVEQASPKRKVIHAEEGVRKKAKADEGVLRGRFILKDLVNASC